MSEERIEKVTILLALREAATGPAKVLNSALKSVAATIAKLNSTGGNFFGGALGIAGGEEVGVRAARGHAERHLHACAALKFTRLHGRSSDR